MNWFKRQYRKLKRKFNEEVKQFKELGFSGYIAQNTITVVSGWADNLGFSGFAQKLRAKRPSIVKDAQKAQEKMEEKIKKEINQLEDLGFAGYVAQNTTTLVAEGADNLGFDETAQKLRARRPSIVKDAQEAQKKMEEKINEEFNQLRDLGAAGYVVQNTSTVIANTLDDLGLDGCAEEVRRQRNKAVEKAKRNQSDLNRKVKEEAKKEVKQDAQNKEPAKEEAKKEVKQDAPVKKEVKKEVKQDAQNKEPAKEEAKKNEPISNKIAVIKDVYLINPPLMPYLERVPIGYEMFNNVEIKQVKGSDGQMVIAVSVDGKPHGPQIKFDGNKIYSEIFDRGNLISSGKSTVKVATSEGVTDITCSVNDKSFGYNMRIDSSGNCEVELIGANGSLMMPTKDCKVSSEFVAIPPKKNNKEAKKEVKQDKAPVKKKVNKKDAQNKEEVNKKDAPVEEVNKEDAQNKEAKKEVKVDDKTNEVDSTKQEKPSMASIAINLAEELKRQTGEKVKVTSAEKAIQSMLNYRVNKKENEPEIKKEEEVTETFTPQTIINTIPNSRER